MPHKMGKYHKMRLVFELPDKSYAPVHIRAMRVERKLDYFATLCSHFQDGAVLMRPIKGVYMQVNHTQTYGLLDLDIRNYNGAEQTTTDFLVHYLILLVHDLI